MRKVISLNPVKNPRTIEELKTSILSQLQSVVTDSEKLMNEIIHSNEVAEIKKKLTDERNSNIEYSDEWEDYESPGYKSGQYEKYLGNCIVLIAEFNTYQQEKNALKNNILRRLKDYINDRGDPIDNLIIVKPSLFNNKNLTTEKLKEVDALVNNIDIAKNMTEVRTLILASVEKNKIWEKHNPFGNGKYGKALTDCLSLIKTYSPESENAASDALQAPSLTQRS